MIAQQPAPAMRCEVAEFDPRGLPLRLRWIQPLESFLGARERGIVIAPVQEQTGDRSMEAITQWKFEIKQRFNAMTAFRYSWWVKKFFVWCQAKGLRLVDVRQNTIEAFLAEMRERYKPNSVSACYGSLASFFSWAADTYGLENPLSKVRKPKRPSASIHLKDAFTDEEVIALLATCKDDPIGKRDRAMISLMAYCALRTAEVIKADLGDIETREGRLILWVWGKGRESKDEYVVLPAPAENALREWLAVRPGPAAGPMFTRLEEHRKTHSAIRIGKNRVRIIVYRRKLSIGILSPRKTTHSLRHTAISNAIRNGAQPLQVMSMARHGDFRTTQTYYHETGRLQHPAEDLIVYTTGAEEKKKDDHES
jgi:integrase/recombinase XerD